MSRVTINNILNLCYVERPRVVDIEVVPRKMVEMIIEHCLEDYKCMCESQGVDQYANGICVESTEIKRYAETLLKQFEEEEE